MTDRPVTTAQFRAERQRQQRIGQELARRYFSVPAESVPDDFLRLLAEADQTPGENRRKP